MRAHVLTQYGKGRNVVSFQAVEKRPLAPDEVRIEVKAVALNPVDVKTQEGEPKMLLPFSPPFVLGVDCAGEVSEVGSTVKDFQPRDPVLAYLGLDRMGAFAESVVVPRTHVARFSNRLKMEEAACLPLPGLSSWLALAEGQVGKGSRVLIHGGGGGVGGIAVQLASLRGAEVFATASSKDIERVKRYGAVRVFDYREEAFDTTLRGMDFVLDTVGQSTLKRSFKVMKPGGVLASLHVPPPASVLKAAHLRVPALMKWLLPVLTYGPHAMARRAGVRLFPVMTVPHGPSLSEIARLADSPGLSVHIDRVLPFEALGEALEHFRSGSARGRIVLKRT